MQDSSFLSQKQRLPGLRFERGLTFLQFLVLLGVIGVLLALVLRFWLGKG